MGPAVRRFALALLLTVAIAASVRGQRDSAAAAQDLAQALQRKYDIVKDWSADFSHAYRGGVLRKQIVERGRLLVKKPGKMRWQYTAPEEKLFVADGVKIYSYIPQDKQVIISSIPATDQATTPAMFLAGKGNLVRDFSSSLVQAPDGAPPGTTALKLIPKSAQREYDWLIVEVDERSLELRGLVTVDAQGGQSSFSFTNLKENAGLADKDFTFKIPRGVDVVTDGPSR
jgi:outer membrane lipoprotein carrier protein